MDRSKGPALIFWELLEKNHHFIFQLMLILHITFFSECFIFLKISFSFHFAWTEDLMKYNLQP